jgi:hypothetical protein
MASRPRLATFHRREREEQIQQERAQAQYIDSGAAARLAKFYEALGRRVSALEERKAIVTRTLENTATIGTVLERLVLRITALEQRPMFRYCGTWSPNEKYDLNDFATDHGSLWHCQKASEGSRPGEGDAWQLAVKKGRDAK